MGEELLKAPWEASDSVEWGGARFLAGMFLGDTVPPGSRRNLG